jgi:hypothetical protein
MIRTEDALGGNVGESQSLIGVLIMKSVVMAPGAGRALSHYCSVIEAPWLVNGGHGASLNRRVS